MPQKYSSLNELLDNEAPAREYFSGLPKYVKDQISQRGDNVNSMASLRDYAENLLRGDT